MTPEQAEKLSQVKARYAARDIYPTGPVRDESRSREGMQKDIEFLLSLIDPEWLESWNALRGK